MRSRDVELIAALVEGSLEDETEARALISSSEAHRAEYEAQKLAYESLSSIPAATLSEHESAALRRDVWTELKAGPAQAEAKAPWYFRWSTAAAGVFILVGVFFAVDRINPDFAPTALIGSDDTGEVAERFDEVTSALDSGDAAPPDQTESAASDDASDEEAVEAEGADGAGAIDVEVLAAVAAGLREGTFKSDDLGRDGFSAATLDPMTECIVAAGLGDQVVVGDFIGAIHYVIAAPADIELGPDTPLSFVDLLSCDGVIYVDG